MKIIGLSGKKQSGKSTIAEYLVKRLPSAVCINFADALKEDVCRMLDVTPAFIETNKAVMRTFLQWYGTDFCRKFKTEDYWIQRWLEKCHRKVPTPGYIIVADIRFPNEFDIIAGFSQPIYRVERNLSSVDAHASEVALDSYRFDDTIMNNNSFDELYSEVENKIVRRLNAYK